MGPTMWTPSTRSVVASATTLQKPAGASIARARPLAMNGNTPVFTDATLAFACSSVRPTHAISGAV